MPIYNNRFYFFIINKLLFIHFFNKFLANVNFRSNNKIYFSFFIISIPYNMVSATSCLIIFTCPNHNQRIVIICRLSIDKTLARISRLSANHANCMKLIHLIGNAHQFWYRLIRLCPETHIKTCDNHSFPIFHILLAKINNLFPKKLYFINANHFSINIFFHNFFHLGNIAHRVGPETVIFM